MGCGCKKKKEEVYVTPEPIPIPEPPKQLTQEEIDWFNNIDIIKPITDGRINGEIE